VFPRGFEGASPFTPAHLLLAVGTTQGTTTEVMGRHKHYQRRKIAIKSRSNPYPITEAGVVWLPPAVVVLLLHYVAPVPRRGRSRRLSQKWGTMRRVVLSELNRRRLPPGAPQGSPLPWHRL